MLISSIFTFILSLMSSYAHLKFAFKNTTHNLPTLLPTLLHVSLKMNIHDLYCAVQ